MSKTSELRTKLIREIEDMVEDAYPNHLHEQDFNFTRLHSNIQARLLHERHYTRIELLRKEAELKKKEEKKITPIKSSLSSHQH